MVTGSGRSSLKILSVGLAPVDDGDEDDQATLGIVWPNSSCCQVNVVPVLLNDVGVIRRGTRGGFVQTAEETFSLEMCGMAASHAASETSVQTPGLIGSSLVSNVKRSCSDGIMGTCSWIISSSSYEQGTGL